MSDDLAANLRVIQQGIRQTFSSESCAARSVQLSRSVRLSLAAQQAWNEGLTLAAEDALAGRTVDLAEVAKAFSARLVELVPELAQPGQDDPT